MAVSYVWAGGQTDTEAVVTVELTAPAAARLVKSPFADLSNPEYIPLNLDANLIGKAPLAGLPPNNILHYGVELDGVLSPKRAHFRTFPTTGEPGDFKIIVGACSNTGNFPVYDRMAEVDAHAIFHLGDLHYENILVEDPQAFRDAYRRHLLQTKAAAFWESIGLASYMWDDHCAWGGNNGGGNLPGRDSCALAYRQVVPHRPLVNAVGPVNHIVDIARTRFIVPDLRFFRDPEADPNTFTKTLLGAEQKQWLFDQLDEAYHDPNVGLTVFDSSLVYHTDEGRSTDTWERYRYEKRELAQFITSLGPPGWLCQIAGDGHFCAIDSGANNNSSAFSILGPSFPILHSAPIVGTGDDESKGGPFDGGKAALTSQHSQYSTMEVTDDGDTITVTWTCYRVDTITGIQTQILPSYTFTNAPRPYIPKFGPGYLIYWDGIAWRSMTLLDYQAGGWKEFVSVLIAQ